MYFKHFHIFTEDNFGHELYCYLILHRVIGRHLLSSPSQQLCWGSCLSKAARFPERWKRKLYDGGDSEYLLNKKNNISIIPNKGNNVFTNTVF